MAVNKTSGIAIIVALAVLIGEYVYVFNAQANPIGALGSLILALINGVILAFAVLLLVIGILLASS